MTYIIGITGGIGGGKSTVGNYLAEMGATIIDTDNIAREVTLPGSDALDEIRRTFGHSVFNADGTLNRRTMAEIVFNDKEKLDQLSSILHPRIRERWLTEARECGEDFVFVIIPLLFENKLEHYFDEIWVVTAEEEERVRRVMKRDHVTRDDVTGRIANQIPEYEKIAAADVVIDTTGGFEATRASTEAALAELKRGPGGNDA